MDVFAAGEWAVATLPDGTQRLVQAGAGAPVDLGRFGRVSPAALTSCRRGLTYWLEGGRLRPMGAAEVLALDANFYGADDAPADADNRGIEDSNSSQALSTADIEALKAAGTAGSSLVDAVVAHSATFGKRTALAQGKYVARKRRKFLAYVRLEAAGLRSLVSYWQAREPRRVLGLRLDSLALLLAHADVRPGRPDRVLLWDDGTLGFLAGAVLCKNGAATVVVAHSGQQMQAPNAVPFCLSPDTRNRLVGLPLSSFGIDNGGCTEKVAEADGPAEASQAMREKYAARRARRDAAAAALAAGFDALVVAVGPAGPTRPGATQCCSDALSVLKRLAPHVRPSGRVVLYAPAAHLLAAAWAHMRASAGRFVDVAACDTFSRPFQPAPGKVHPAMTSSGGTGALLSASVVTSGV